MLRDPKEVPALTKEPMLRGGHDEAGELWIPLEDIAAAQGRHIGVNQLRRRNLLLGEDYRVVNVASDDDKVVTQIWPQPTTFDGEVAQIIVSEPGLRRLLMWRSHLPTAVLQESLFEQSLPAAALAIDQANQGNQPGSSSRAAVVETARMVYQLPGQFFRLVFELRAFARSRRR